MKLFLFLPLALLPACSTTSEMFNRGETDADVSFHRAAALHMMSDKPQAMRAYLGYDQTFQPQSRTRLYYQPYYK